MPVTRPDPAAAVALFQDGVTRHARGDTGGAARCYRDALARDPSLAEARNNLATILAADGDVAEAERLLREAIATRAAYGEAHNNLGLLMAKRGDHAAALPLFTRAVALEADRAAWWANLGNSAVECFRHAEALAAYDRALGLDPADADVHANRALALRGLRRPEEAIAALEHAIARQPGHVNALCNLAVVLKEQKRLDESVAIIERALALEPRNVHLLANAAAIHEARGDRPRTQELAARAAAIDPHYAEAYNLMANVALEAGRYDDALALYEKARGLDPDNGNANWNLALIWLLRGDFARGWPQFEWRKRLQSVVFDHDEYAGPEWTGDALAGRDLLLHSEQGIGDALQFVRYARDLKARGAGRLYLECPYPIVPLLSGVEGLDAVVARGAPLPAYDVHANLMSLPALLGTTLDTIPARVPYLPVEPRPVAARVPRVPGTLAVGIVWTGNPLHARDFLRSAPLDAFRALAAIDGVRLVSLQKGAAAERELAARPIPGCVDLAADLIDFRDTAAVIDALDLVITVDTSVAHLAGALGKETWLLLPHVPDFRWMLGRTDSPWYPTMRLFRQPAPLQWGPVFEEVARALRARAGALDGARPEAQAPGDVVTVTSVTRVADGRPRFDLWCPLAALADPRRFAEYEAEVTGAGHALPVRAFLDECLEPGDVVVDAAPGLGIVALSAATAPEPPAAVLLVDGGDDGARVAQLVARRAPAVAARAVPRLEDAEGAGRRLVLHVGAGTPAPMVARVIGSGAMRPAVIAWSPVAPDAAVDALEALQAVGYVTAALTLRDGEPSLDAIDDPAHEQALVSLLPEALEALERRATARATPAPGAVTAATGPDAAPVLVGIDWEVRGDTGWGVYGTNLALELTRTPGWRPALFAAEAADLPPVARHRLRRALDEAVQRVQAVNAAGRPVRHEGIMLRGFGNNFGHGPLLERVGARCNVGVIFFEDTAFDAGAMARARALDLIVAGSAWNAEVLRAQGLAHVRTVLQGVDPTIFHPAPRSGQLEGRFVVFSGGKLEYRKGQDLVVAAFRAFRQRHPEALLVTAWHNNWPALIADLELAGHVRGTPTVVNGQLAVAPWLVAQGIPAEAVLDVGRTPNGMMGQVVREADVALFPNRCEGGTNLVAMECMAAGVPTIVSANTGHGDLVATGGALALGRQRPVRPPTRFFRATDGWGESDVDEIVEALEQVYRDRAAAAALAARGAQAMTDWSWAAQVARFLQELAPFAAALQRPSTG